MCPLLNAPNRGFADYQRQGPYDSGTLYSNTVFPLTFEQTPVLDVSRFAYLGGLDGISGGDAYVTFTWFADKAGLTMTGIRKFSLTGVMGKGTSQYRLVNLGPFVTVSWTRIGGAAIDHQVWLFGTNRYHPVEFIPVDSQVFAIVNKPIGAGVTDAIWPTTYYAGPLPVWFAVTGAGPWVVQLQQLATNGVYQLVDQYGGLTPADHHFTFSVPVGGWAFNVQNTNAGPGSYWFGAAPALTGAT